MKTHFKNLRRLMTLAAIVAPILLLIAFLSFAAGLIGWATLPALLAFALLLAFPFHSIKASKSRNSDTGLALWTTRVAILFFLLWLFQLQEFQLLLDRFTSNGAFWDWRLIAAASIWAFQGSYSNWHVVKKLEDKEIFIFYNQQPCH